MAHFLLPWLRMSRFTEVSMTPPPQNPQPVWRVVAIKALLVLVASAQLVDVLSTNRALAAGRGLYEANPVMSFSMDTLGTFWWLPKLVIALVLIGLAVRLKRVTLREFVLATLVEITYLGVLVNNFLH
jgi:hypothetical protein